MPAAPVLDRPPAQYTPCMPHVFHFASEGCAPLDCVQLARSIMGRSRPLSMWLPPRDSGGEKKGLRLGEQLASPLWRQVRRLNWALASDRLIESDGVIRGVGVHQLEVSRALGRIMEAVPLTYPALAAVDPSTLAQLVALGPEVLQSVGESPDLLPFIEKELQPVDLVDVLSIPAPL